MTWRGWNMCPKTGLTLCYLLLFAASVIRRSDAKVEEEVVGVEANVDRLSDEDASHSLVYDASSFRSEMDKRRMHFVMLFKSRFVAETSTLVVTSVGISHGLSSDRILSHFDCIYLSSRCNCIFIIYIVSYTIT